MIRPALLLLALALTMPAAAQTLPPVPIPGQTLPAMPMPQPTYPPSPFAQPPQPPTPAPQPPLPPVPVPQPPPPQPPSPQQTPPPTPAPAVTWVPRPAADLVGLDKVTARLTPLSGRIGQTVSFGSLSITIGACLVRAPDQPADQAVYLDITDSRVAGHDFHGWMLLSEPGVSMLAHPIYDVRLIACRA